MLLRELFFPSCGEYRLLFTVVLGLLIAVASLCYRARLKVLGSQYSQHAGSVVVTYRLSCSMAHGTFLNQE